MSDEPYMHLIILLRIWILQCDGQYTLFSRIRILCIRHAIDFLCLKMLKLSCSYASQFFVFNLKHLIFMLFVVFYNEHLILNR